MRRHCVRLGSMVVVRWWFRNRGEARFHSRNGRVSYPPGKALGPLIGQRGGMTCESVGKRKRRFASCTLHTAPATLVSSYFGH